MKKFVFSLLAIGVMTFASAAEVNVGEKIEPTKKETVSKKEQKAVAKEATAKNEEVKTVTCTIYTGQGASGYSTYEYSCFFCWGGSHNGCVAAAAEAYGLVL